MHHRMDQWLQTILFKWQKDYKTDMFRIKMVLSDRIDYLLNGKYHRDDDGPALDYKNGSGEWYKNGIRHRLDGPACEYVDGSKYWFLNGKKHRIDGPAIEKKSGTKEWWVNGLRHRDDGGPAIIYHVDRKEWWANGKRHRLEGPAIEDHGSFEWYRNGIKTHV